jgi:hypothetical protein
MIVVSACKKEARELPPEQLICIGTWKMIDAKLTGNGSQVLTDSCIRDNEFGLSPTDGRLPYGSLVEGPLKCDSTGNDIIVFRWNLDNATKIFQPSIFLFPGNTSFDYHIIELTRDKLVVSTEMFEAGAIQNVTITYVH